jgi:hypothetical protein
MMLAISVAVLRISSANSVHLEGLRKASDEGRAVP